MSTHDEDTQPGLSPETVAAMAKEARLAEIEVARDERGRSFADLENDPDAQADLLEKRYALAHLGTTKDGKQARFRNDATLPGFDVVRNRGQNYEYFYPDENAWAMAESRRVNEAQDKVKAASKVSVDAARQAMRDGLDAIMSEYKVHVQPRPEYVPVVVDRIAELMRTRPDLRRLISAFKVRLGPAERKTKLGTEQLPTIALYPMPGPGDDAADRGSGRENMERVIFALADALADLEAAASGVVPRDNAKATELIHVAQSGGDLKLRLKRLGIIDEFFERDADGRYAFRKGEVPPNERDELEALRRELDRATDRGENPAANLFWRRTVVAGREAELKERIEDLEEDVRDHAYVGTLAQRAAEQSRRMEEETGPLRKEYRAVTAELKELDRAIGRLKTGDAEPARDLLEAEASLLAAEAAAAPDGEARENAERERRRVLASIGNLRMSARQHQLAEKLRRAPNE